MTKRPIRSEGQGLDYSARLARRLPRLGNHLAIVVTLHSLTEFLLDRMIVARSPTSKRILDDSRSFSYAVKLVLVRNMALIDDGLFRNLDALRRLRNEYAHGLDVDLASKLNLGFMDPQGKPVFRKLSVTQSEVRDDPEGAGIKALMVISKATFSRLHAICLSLGIDLTNG